MKRTIILSAVLASMAMFSQADVLWMTELSATGPRWTDAVLTPIDGAAKAADANYNSGWLNDYAGGSYDLMSPTDTWGNYVIGSDGISWGDAGFTFSMTINEEVSLDSLNFGTFTWAQEEPGPATFMLYYTQVYVNDRPIQTDEIYEITVDPQTTPGGSTTSINIPMGGIIVHPGDTIGVTICVMGYGMPRANFGMSHIEAEGTTRGPGTH